MSPEELALILQQLEPELPVLVGEDAWAEISPAWTDKLDQLRTSQELVEKMRLAAELRTMLAPYALVRQQLQIATGGVGQYQQLLMQVADWVEKNGGDQNQVSQLRAAAALHSQTAQTRHIVLQGVGQNAKSIKWANLEFDFGEATTTVAGALAAISDIADPERNYWLMTAGILVIIGSLLKTLTKEISAQDAAVFWGIVQAQVQLPSRKVDTAKVVGYTNQERAKVHLEPLSELQVRHSLHNLVAMGSVKEMDGNGETWRVVESYTIKG